MDANTTKRIATEHDDELHDEDFDDEDEGMSEEDLERFLAEAIEMYADESEEPRRIAVATFRDCGVLTMNRGLVLTVGDDEFQLTIVKSR